MRKGYPKREDWTDIGADSLLDLSESVQRRIEQAVTRYAETGHGIVEKIEGHPVKKLRVGDYRVILDETATTVRVLLAGDRKNVYARFRQRLRR